MEKEKLESLLIEYIDGTLNAADTERARQLIRDDAGAGKLYLQLKEVIGALNDSPVMEPSGDMTSRFGQLLKEELKTAEKPEGRQRYFSPLVYRAAAGIGLVLFLFSYWMYKGEQQQRELAALRKEMEATKQVMMAMLENQQSASSRMRGATVAYNMDKPDDQIVAALIRTMNDDPNTNVRLAALEALGKFNRQAHVRTALIASLATQKDPLVQIALIQLMVQMKEKGAVRELENMVNDVQTIKAVKDEAYTGIVKLS